MAGLGSQHHQTWEMRMSETQFSFRPLIFQWGVGLGDAISPMRCICVAWALYTLGVDGGHAWGGDGGRGGGRRCLLNAF